MKQQTKGYLCILGGFLTHLMVGAFYLWGNISLNVTSYYRYHGYDDIKSSTVSLVFPTIYFGIAFGSYMGVSFARKYGYRKVSLINLFFYCGSQFIATYVNFYWFVLFMGFLPGVFIGVEYLLPVDNAINYFPNKKGLVSGLILCGFGFGALIFNPVIQQLANPDNISLQPDGYYPIEVADKIPSALRYMSLIYLVGGVIGVFMLVPYKKQEIMEPKVQDTEYRLSENEENKNEKCEFKVSSIRELFNYAEVYYSCVHLFCLTGFGFMVVSQYKSFGTKHISDDKFFSLVGSIGGLVNGLSRFLWSFLLDFFNGQILILANIILVILISLTINMIVDEKLLYLTWVSLVYLQYGGLFTLLPGICTEQFGKKFGPYAFNISYSMLPFSNLLQFCLVKYMNEQFYKGNKWILSNNADIHNNQILFEKEERRR
ncbi:hypothetical protein pb186bvf_015767 [Paramecium bursaria]